MLRGLDQVGRLVGVVRQVIELVGDTRLEMADELLFGRADHSHPGDFRVMHVILADQRIVPIRRDGRTRRWSKALDRQCKRTTRWAASARAPRPGPWSVILPQVLWRG